MKNALRTLIVSTVAYCTLSLGYISYHCPAPADIQIKSFKDHYGRRQCTYTGRLSPSKIILTHITQGLKKNACPPVPGKLSSVILFVSDKEKGTISCAYGPPNAKNVSWGMANGTKKGKQKLASCRLASTNTPSTSRDTYTHCESSPKKCSLICQ